MKKYFIIATFLMACAINVNAEELLGDLYVPDVVVEAGTTSTTLQLCLKNNEAGATGNVGFEAILQAPEGFTVTKAARGSRLKGRVDPEDEESDYIFTFAQSNKEAGKYVQAFCTQKATIPGTDGEVVKYTISIPKDASGDYTFTLLNIVVSNGSSTISTYTSTTSKLTVGTTGIKDVNADGMQADGKYYKNGEIIIKKGNKEYNAIGAINK